VEVLQWSGLSLMMRSIYLDVLGQGHLVLFGFGLRDLHRFGLFVLREKPSWRFWDEPANTKTLFMTTYLILKKRILSLFIFSFQKNLPTILTSWLRHAIKAERVFLTSSRTGRGCRAGLFNFSSKWAE